MTRRSRKPKLLILGGSGFVSGTLARVAMADGWKVWSLTRGKRPLARGIVRLTADRHDTSSFTNVVEAAGVRWDLVVDCIGYAPADMRQDLAVFPSRAKHFVFISTDFVFDPARRMFPQGEESRHYLTDGYGGHKRTCEMLLSKADTRGMRWTVVRPCHIYGPGSQLGCLPMHGRDAELIQRLRRGEALRLVGGGHFLQQPIFVCDLAKLILSIPGKARSRETIFCAAGPDIIESREYYRIIADTLGVELKVEEVPVSSHLTAHPDTAPFLCHRIYDLRTLREAGLAVPGTPIERGLREHVSSLLSSPYA